MHAWLLHVSSNKKGERGTPGCSDYSGFQSQDEDDAWNSTSELSDRKNSLGFVGITQRRMQNRNLSKASARKLRMFICFVDKEQ